MGVRADLLVGVGVGPGDPELVTIKAVRALREAGTIVVPATESSSLGGSPGRAETVVLAHLGEAAGPRIRRITFAMRERPGVGRDRRAAWETAADTVIEALEAGEGPVAFATLGDPSVYSTFSAVARVVSARRPTTTVEVIPGIMAMQDLAARSRTPLCEGDQPLTLMAATAGPEAYRAALRAGATVVAYKAGRQVPAFLAVLAEEGLLADTVVGCDLGLSSERIVRADQLDPASPTPYLTTIVASANRCHPGGDQ